MSVVTQSVLRITGGAERLKSCVDTRTRELLDEANASFRHVVSERCAGLIGKRIMEGVRSPSPTCEFARDTTAHETIHFGKKEITQSLSTGVYSIAELSEKRESQVEIMTLEGAIPGNVYGNQIEPSGALFSIDALTAWDKIESGATLSVRHIDLYSKPLAFLSDELITLSGCGTFAKLFVSGGNRSVSGRHSDPSDVVVIILDGKKHFRIEPGIGVEGKGLDRVLNKGDVLLIPSNWHHLVTPLNAISIHVTFGIMHFEYWRQLDVIPTHLGYRGPCQDQTTMAGLIPPKNPPLFTTSFTSESIVRTATPAGLVPISQNGNAASVLGAGRLVSMSGSELRVLLTVHSSGSATISDVAEQEGMSVDKVIQIVEQLAQARLVGGEPYERAPSRKKRS